MNYHLPKQLNCQNEKNKGKLLKRSKDIEALRLACIQNILKLFDLKNYHLQPKGLKMLIISKLDKRRSSFNSSKTSFTQKESRTWAHKQIRIVMLDD
ncbi:hypothetical protein BpHYR1_022342 [Brachionus plicatilis]|uniref:Uncharacterized protein n=1 Tax=Brachionus plicatilis TaxID=10195 RepID=A0A3M7T355_BRAPC|nr:hypothetical protein BpHYR1_022342 [Brachionus plicatilis]